MDTKPLSANIVEQLNIFVQGNTPQRLSRNLRNLLLQYLATHKDGHTFNFDDLLTDLVALFELLDSMEQHP